MKTAYKMADGRKVEGRRVIVDVERGRAVPNWCVCWLRTPASARCGWELKPALPHHRRAHADASKCRQNPSLLGTRDLPADMLGFACAGGPGAWVAARAAKAGSPSRRRRARERPCLGCPGCPARRPAAQHPHLGWQRCPLRPHPWSGPGAPSALDLQATLPVIQCHELPADNRTCKVFTYEDICSPFQVFSSCHAIKHIAGGTHFLAN